MFFLIIDSLGIQLVLQIVYPLCEPANAFVVSSNIRGLLLCC